MLQSLQRTLLLMLGMLLLLSGCAPQKEHATTETTSYPTEVAFNDLYITLNESLPYTAPTGENYQGLAVTVQNTSNDSVTLKSAFSSIAILDDQGHDIGKQLDWLTADEHGTDLAKIKKLSPQQIIAGHIYFRSTAATPNSIVLTKKKQHAQLQVPQSPTIALLEHNAKPMLDDSVEAKVQVIRTWFNQIEANAQANQMNVTHQGDTTFYESEVYRKITYHYEEMTYHLYYMNDELFFVYSYPNVNSVDFENRYYFQDGNMIRWIRSNGETINQQAGLANPSYLQEEANILYLEQFTAQ
ncbi:MAG TPA: hypothetical protein VIR26_08430 [Metalysinibacillus sp.]